MTNLAWCTDVHLDFLQDQDVINFAKQLIVQNPDGIVITGDISTAKHVVYHLSIIEKVVQRPVYFVLGNHDFYGGSIDEIRKEMKELTNMSQYLKYLPTVQYMPLTQTTAILGADGWYDGLNGNAKNSSMMLNDWTAIKEFAKVSQGGYNRASIIDVAQKLAHESVLHMHGAIKSAVRYHNNLIIATHVPPFPETHIYAGKIGDAEAQPWFTSRMLGDMLLAASKAFPKVMFTVLAGHTHGKFSGKIADNLHVMVGGAEYRMPKLQETISVQ